MGSNTKSAWKLEEFVAHAGNVTCLALGRKSGRVMVTGGEDKKVNMWAIGKPNCIMPLSGHTSAVEAVAFNSDEDMVMAGSVSGALKIWDLEAVKIVRTLTGHKSSIRSLDFHPYGDFVASGSLDTNVKLWDIRRKGCIFTYKGHEGCINGLRFSPDGRWIASCAEDGVAKLWDLTAGKTLTNFSLHKGPINAIEFHPKEFLLATASSDKTVKFWDLEKFQLISSTDDTSHVRNLCFSPEGDCVFAGAVDHLKVYSWEPANCLATAYPGWAKVASIALAEPQLIGASFSQSNVSTYVVDIKKLRAKGEDSPSPVSRPGLSTSERRSFNTPDRPPTHSSKRIPPEEPADDGDDDSMANIQVNEDYQKIFQPKSRLISPAHDPPSKEPARNYQRNDRPATQATGGVRKEAARSEPPRADPPRNDPPAPYKSPSGLPFDDFMPKNKLPDISVSKSGTEEDTISAHGDGHITMMRVLDSRARNLQIVRVLWAGGNTTTALDSAISMNDHSVLADLLNQITQRPSLWNLDLCVSLLPHLKELLNSRHDNYVHSGCLALRVILKNFAPVIKGNISSPASIGVDISREDRVRKCRRCYECLMNLSPIIDEGSRRQSKNTNRFRELQIMMEDIN